MDQAVHKIDADQQGAKSVRLFSMVP